MYDERVEVFFGDANPAEARVYAELTGDDLSGLSLSGKVRGPMCEYARTLPANVSLRSLGPGESLLAEAILPDPCFWTPETPFFYQVEVTVSRGPEALGRIERMLGIRRLAARGRNLMLDAKRWVLRGVARRAQLAAELAEWHEFGAAMLVEEPSEQLCAEASRLGVLLVVRECADLRRMGRFPAVAMAIVGAEGPHERPRNLLLGQHFGPGEPVTPAPWAQVVLCEDREVRELARRVDGIALPVLAWQPGGRFATLAEARAGCDRLQRDLATHGDFEGYIV